MARADGRDVHASAGGTRHAASRQSGAPPAGPARDPEVTAVTLAPAAPAPPPWLRLRWLGALALLGAVALVAEPRARAAWEVHLQAPAHADYALCMVGPRGPSLLREGSREYASLLRRRLVSAAAAERPFERCAPLFLKTGGTEEGARVHRLRADEFPEWGGDAADRRAPGAPSLAAFDVTLRPLVARARSAWPFLSGGVLHLVQPSRRAFEAVHPAELPRPFRGAGLPAWRAQYRSARRIGDSWWLAVGAGANLSVHRSRDGGLTWEAASPLEPGVEEIRERCVAPGSGRSVTFGTSDDGRWLTATWQDGEAAPHTVPVAPSDRRIAGASCDERALVVATHPEKDATVTLALCPHRAPCEAVELPALGLGPPRYPLDVARVEGALVVSVVAHGIVRVASSRDDGRTWTPWTVAFDAGTAGTPASEGRREGATPGRLLVLGERLLLHGVAGKEGTYPLLVSDDQGASFRGQPAR